MGLFSRKKDADGMYTGDAPVSAPGYDGAAPGAYSGQAFQDHAEHIPAGPAAPATGAYIPPTAAQSGVAGSSYMVGTPAPQVVTGGQLDPATAARIQRALAGRSGKSSKLACALVAVPLLGGLVAAGIGIYSAVSATGIVGDVLGSVSSALGGGSTGGAAGPEGAAPGGRHEGMTKLGEPVSIRTGDAAYSITVFGAEIQPGDGWGFDSAGDRPHLVVEAQISRTDTGTAPITFTGWNWSVVGAAGDRVMGDIISNYAPSLDGPELVGGQTARGYVSFDTTATATSLTVASGPAGAGLATWQLSATTPKPVAGVVGKAARAEITRPGFTVTIGNAEVVVKADPRIGYYPESGQYLALPITLTGVDGTSGSLGNVGGEAFVFKPDGAPALYSRFNGVEGAPSFFSVDAAEPTNGFLAFDTTATSGRLELRSGADRPIITWQIKPVS